ncbi:spermatogenesis-associated protein 6 [Aplysia californica]|uniref:Spermatogenesis-associated protein 6 n=1 Tax=Aplysia californica TaxID=6500 RepID=A0ABM1A945_APLCA|nr:spermatogenesis-associated protein 6 [Aplysia californica]
MPRRALRCIVDLQLQLVSAPGVWLPSREDVYLSVSLFNQYRNTRLVASVFPLLIHEKFRFEKTYYTAVDPAHVADMLADELVIFELVQLSEYTDGAVRLASYSTNARDFLYPYPTLAPSYSAHDREVLMCRTIAFPGISPKLEFITTTVIKESFSPELDALDDAVELDMESRSRSRARRRSLSRSRSLSPSLRRKMADISLDDTIDPRPPFVVRKLSTDLIGRKPGGVTDKGAESKPKRSASPYRSPSRIGKRKVMEAWSARPLRPISPLPSYRLSKVIRSTYEDPLPVFKPKYDDLDCEVAALTSTTPSYKSPRPRSVSPLLYRSPFSLRYADPLSPTYYERVLEREREYARSRRLARVYDSYYKSIDDLDLELRLARLRTERLLY